LDEIDDVTLFESNTQDSSQTEANELWEEENKYVLLDRLFKFIEQEGPMNDVLAGYFNKLVSLLIYQKQ
jgi:hypothetical protein